MYKIIRKSDSKEIAINYTKEFGKGEPLDPYIRFEDRNKVIWKNVEGKYPNNSYWRLPLPEEDNIFCGEYQDENPSIIIKQNKTLIKPSCYIISDPEWLKERYNNFPYYVKSNSVWESLMSKGVYQVIQTPLGMVNISDSYLAGIYFGHHKEIRIRLKLHNNKKDSYCETFENLHPHIADMQMKERLFCLVADHWESQNPRKTYALSYGEKYERIHYELFRWENDEGLQYVVETTPLADSAKRDRKYYNTFKSAYRDFLSYVIIEKYKQLLETK